MKVSTLSFKSLGLSDTLLTTLTAQGYETPTPIQAKAIPAVIRGRDVIGLAQTGTGKTAAFSLPILHNLTKDDMDGPKGNHNKFRPIKVLILSPTRELAAQIETAIRSYAKGLPLRTACVVGGVSIRRQQDRLRQGVDILVATPGRLEDLMQQRSVVLDQIQTVILDEADQMLDIGFMPAIRRILGKTPRQRQTLLFSATMPKEIKKLSQDHLSDPIEVSVAPISATADRIEQKIIHLDKGQKLDVTARIVAKRPTAKIIIFTRTKRGADKVAKRLNKDGLGAGAIHGNKSQNQRVRALAAFTSGDSPVLVATDIAARGIDVRGVELVINFELPEVPEPYVHRIGRTGRAGASGQAISLCCSEEIKLLIAIEKLTKQNIPAETPSGERVTQKPKFTPKPKPDNQGRRGGGGNRNRSGGGGGGGGRSGGGKGGQKRRSGGGKPKSSGGGGGYNPAADGGSSASSGATKPRRDNRRRTTKPAPK
ncbi:MAG: DEAD/DEAH box helicase [Robiginitomaculum sp.]